MSGIDAHPIVPVTVRDPAAPALPLLGPRRGHEPASLVSLLRAAETVPERMLLASIDAALGRLQALGGSVGPEVLAAFEPLIVAWQDATGLEWGLVSHETS